MKPFRAFGFSDHTWMEGVALSSVCGLAVAADRKLTIWGCS
jgi:hypothetical protein